MKNVNAVGLSRTVAAFALSLGFGIGHVHAGDATTSVQKPTTPVATQQPIIVAGIASIAKSVGDRPLSKNEKKARANLEEQRADVKRLLDKIAGLQKQLEDPTLSTKRKAKLQRELNAANRKLPDEQKDVIVAEQRLQLAEARADRKVAERELKEAEKAFAAGLITKEELDEKRKALADANYRVNNQKGDVANAKKNLPVDDSDDDPFATPT